MKKRFLTFGILLAATGVVLNFLSTLKLLTLQLRIVRKKIMKELMLLKIT